MRLPAAERRARLLTRRVNALLAEVERYVEAEARDRDPLVLAQAMERYVEALRRRRRAPRKPLDPRRILHPDVARLIFHIR